jgi:mono/diheme cytochrome c family protein
MPPTTSTTPPTTTAGGTVSFSLTIQPLISANCSCHTGGSSSGGVSLSSYTAIRAQVTPGNATTSRLYQSLIGSNGVSRMPPGGSLSPAQIQNVANWINQGALNTTGTSPPTTTPPPITTTGPGQVSYSRDVQPILNTYCVSCHGSRNPQEGINLSTYTGTRAIVRPGNGTSSRLYQSLVGANDVERMPPNQRLSSAQIQTILNWINQGALNN